MKREIKLVPAREEDIDACAQIIENARVKSQIFKTKSPCNR